MSSSFPLVDISAAPSATQSLVALRALLLSALEDIESTILAVDTRTAAHDARTCAADALELLRSIRSDVASHLPDLPDVPSLGAVRSHLYHSLADISSAIEDLCTRLSGTHIASLSPRLQSLQTHLRAVDLDRHAFPGSARFSGLVGSIMSSELASELSNDVSEAGDMARDIARAIKRSLSGSKLIHYVDLPPQWRNNPFVLRGYRFIPLDKWPLIVLSLFAWHNETLNIHTHFIPLVLWLINCIPIFSSSSSLRDVPETTFVIFALTCLFTSVLWHTMSGCAHHDGMDLCARIDYVGIGWLISASVGTIVHYGFQCHPLLGNFFIACCFLTGLAGNVFPFLNWFNDPAYKLARVSVFLSMAFTSIAPLAVLAYLHSPWQIIAFINPVWPSLISYLIGLVFYISHIPERFLSKRYSHWLDWCGGGSHAIWHAFIVLAISQHRTAMASLRDGISCALAS